MEKWRDGRERREKPSCVYRLTSIVRKRGQARRKPLVQAPIWKNKSDASPGFSPLESGDRHVFASLSLSQSPFSNPRRPGPLSSPFRFPYRHLGNIQQHDKIYKE